MTLIISHYKNDVKNIQDILKDHDKNEYDELIF